MIRSKLKALTCPQHIFQRTRAGNFEVNGQIWPEFETPTVSLKTSFEWPKVSAFDLTEDKQSILIPFNCVLVHTQVSDRYPFMSTCSQLHVIHSYHKCIHFNFISNWYNKST